MIVGWNNFAWFAIPSLLLWISGATAAWKEKRSLAVTLTMAGILIFMAFISGLWISLERPPLRTMGETRLWYAFFLPVAGILIYIRWKYKWILSFSSMMALMFTCINLFRPEIHSKTLMPALQSPWFAPHVTVYMFAYALLGAATVMAVWLLARGGKATDREYHICDNLVQIGLAFMTFGMLFGALWAKEAWGHCWSWDPKETWAAITWLSYLGYIHFRLSSPNEKKAAMWMLIFSFACLQMSWWGVNHLPSAQGRSVHIYSK